MKKTKLILILFLIVALALSMTACFGGDEEEQPQQDPAPQEQTGEDEQEEGGEVIVVNPGDEDETALVTINQLDDLRRSYGSLTYLQAREGGEGLVASTVYQKGDKVLVTRNIEGSTTYEYYDLTDNTVISYSGGDTEAYLIPLPDDGSGKPELVTDFDYLADYSIVGEEVINNKECRKLESNDGKKHIWVDIANGLPVSYEYREYADGDLIYSCEYSNYQDGDIADSVFQLPSEVTLIEN